MEPARQVRMVALTGLQVGAIAIARRDLLQQFPTAHEQHRRELGRGASFMGARPGVSGPPLGATSGAHQVLDESLDGDSHTRPDRPRWPGRRRPWAEQIEAHRLGASLPVLNVIRPIGHCPLALNYWRTTAIDRDQN